MVVYANDTISLLQTNVALLLKLAKKGAAVTDPGALPGLRSITMEFDPERFADCKLKAKALAQKIGGDPADTQKVKPPTRQCGCNGGGDNPVSKRASRRNTTTNTRGQPCEKYLAGVPCIYWDQNTGRCPYQHKRDPSGVEAVSDDESAKPAGRQGKASAATKKLKKKAAD